MSLNWVMMQDSLREPIPLPGETVILFQDSTELTLIIPAEIPDALTDASMPVAVARKWTESGSIWLTDQRLIFVSSLSPSRPPSFDSLSILLPSILATSFVQPYFSGNYLSLSILPSVEGGLTPGTKAEVRFKDRGIFQFVQLLERTREIAIRKRRVEMQAESENLPLYEAPPGPPPGQQATNSSSPTNHDEPPGYHI